MYFAVFIMLKPYRWSIRMSSHHQRSTVGNVSLPRPRVPHTPEFPVKLVGFRELHAPFLNERRTRDSVQGSVQEIRGYGAPSVVVMKHPYEGINTLHLLTQTPPPGCPSVRTNLQRGHYFAI
jgi:hypothetical protein